MRLLITGSSGQLGSELKDLSLKYKQLEFFFTDFTDLDICDFDLVQSYITDHKIDAVINCAAYTAVDKAEEEPAIANRINAEGISNLVKALQLVNGKLIHISTDYVFNGNNFLPYHELDSVSPIGVYGETKRLGELAVINSNIDSIVIRTSWLYSSRGNNFLKTMLRLGNEKETLGVIFDQIGTPTYAKDLAQTCLDILCKSKSSNINKNGSLYHFSNEGVASWYDFAFSIMQIAKIKCEVKPIQTCDYPTLAKRPHYSVLNKSKIKNDFNLEIPHWRDSLKKCINKINIKK